MNNLTFLSSAKDFLVCREWTKKLCSAKRILLATNKKILCSAKGNPLPVKEIPFYCKRTLASHKNFNFAGNFKKCVFAIFSLQDFYSIFLKYKQNTKISLEKLDHLDAWPQVLQLQALRTSTSAAMSLVIYNWKRKIINNFLNLLDFLF